MAEKPPSVEKGTFVEPARLPAAPAAKPSDPLINIEGVSQSDKSKVAKKKGPEPKKFVPNFTCKGKPINVEHSAFESFSVVFNLFAQATLPKDEKFLHKLSNHELKRDGFHSVLKVNFIFSSSPFVNDNFTNIFFRGCSVPLRP